MHKALTQLVNKYPSLKSCLKEIDQTLALWQKCVTSGGKILLCGNGGSAADAEHIVGELLKGFLLKRRLTQTHIDKIKEHYPADAEFLAQNLQISIPAISLVSGAAITTAVANDNNPHFIFAQQVYGLGNPGDVLVGISTSGNSKNVLYAAQVAKVRGLTVVGLTGENGGKLKEYADVTIKVPANDVADIQELHLPVYHALCYGLEDLLYGSNESAVTNVVSLTAKKAEVMGVAPVFPESLELVIFDFDGVFTDNKVYTNQEGAETVVCDRRDGLGIGFLKKENVPMMIVSTEENPVVAARAKKMGLSVTQACSDKAAFLCEYFAKNKINPKNVVYIGNDLNDIDAMKLVGFSVAPADSHPQVIQIASLVLEEKGGHGAVREFCEFILTKIHKEDSKCHYS